MSERYTRRDAEAQFARLARALGVPYADLQGNVWEPDRDAIALGGSRHEYVSTRQLWERRDGRNVAYVGAWHLDYNGAYGGYVVAEMANEGGGESCPLGNIRRSAREFCEAIHFTFDVLEAQERRQEVQA